MTDETTTKLWEINNTIVITIPKGIVEDTSFPFLLEKDNDGTIQTIELKIKIEKGKLTIQNIEKS